MKRPALSASNLGAAELCPAKPRMEAPFAEEESEYSKRGTRLHRYFRTKRDRSELPPDDQDLLARADWLADEVIQNFRETFGIIDDELFTDEHEVKMDGIVPGHADNILTWRNGRYACILDLKSGVRPAEEAPDNYQLGCYALLQYDRSPFEKCCVAIIQPDAFGRRVTAALYHSSAMPDVRDSIRKIQDAANDVESSPVAGEYQCCYCRAKAACPAYTDFRSLSIVETRAVSTLDNQELVKVHQAIQFANRIKDEIQNELRIRIEKGALPGKLRATGATREVNDPTGLWNAIYERYCLNPKFSASQYDACRKLSFGAFEELIQKIEECTAKRAREIARGISTPYVTETPKQPVPIPEI